MAQGKQAHAAGAARTRRTAAAVSSQLIWLQIQEWRQLLSHNSTPAGLNVAPNLQKRGGSADRMSCRQWRLTNHAQAGWRQRVNMHCAARSDGETHRFPSLAVKVFIHVPIAKHETAGRQERLSCLSKASVDSRQKGASPTPVLVT